MVKNLSKLKEQLLAAVAFAISEALKTHTLNKANQEPRSTSPNNLSKDVPLQNNDKDSDFQRVGISDPINITVALSGGLDSIVLLHLTHTMIQTSSVVKLLEQSHETRDLLKNSVIQLNAFHVNHGISENAEHWQQFCQVECEKLNVPFYFKSIVLQKRAQNSLEADARDARYLLIENHIANLTNKNSDKPHCLLLGQHQTDQAETFLLQLQRGAGLKGLACMPGQASNKHGQYYLRPLLGFTREQLHAYAQAEQLNWIEDESNLDQTYMRNFIRHSLLPLWQQKAPQVIKTIARSATHAAQAQVALTEYMQLLSKDLLDANQEIRVKELQEQSIATQQSFLRFWLGNFVDKLPSQSQLDDIVGLTADSKNKTPHIILHLDESNDTQKNTKQQVVVEKFQNVLRLIKVKQYDEVELNFEAGKTLTIEALWRFTCAGQSNQQGQKVDLQRPSLKEINIPVDKVILQFGQSHLRARFCQNRPSKTLKQWYQELGISPLARKQTAVLVNEQKLVALILPRSKNTEKLGGIIMKNCVVYPNLDYQNDTNCVRVSIEMLSISNTYN